MLLNTGLRGGTVSSVKSAPTKNFIIISTYHHLPKDLQTRHLVVHNIFVNLPSAQQVAKEESFAASENNA
jgi:hypothetical protein